MELCQVHTLGYESKTSLLLLLWFSWTSCPLISFSTKRGSSGIPWPLNYSAVVLHLHTPWSSRFVEWIHSKSTMIFPCKSPGPTAQSMYNSFLLLLVKNAERLILVIGEFPHRWENHNLTKFHKDRMREKQGFIFTSASHLKSLSKKKASCHAMLYHHEVTCDR